VFSLLAAATCVPEGYYSQSTTQRQSKSGVTDLGSLVDALQRQHARVELPKDGDISQPFFSVAGRRITLEGEDVQVFEYKSVATARREARQVAADGRTVGTTQITWVSAPHFFKTGKLIVLYVGENPAVLKALGAALGRQFAGG
jgi:hypothetical protein